MTLIPKKLPFWALALTLLATGCRVGPKYVKPVVPTYQAPDAFKDAYKELDPNWHAADPADARLKGDWWTLFHESDLSLLEVRAAIQNQSLRSAAARYEQARAQIGINNASRFPVLGTAPFVGGTRTSAARPYASTASAQSNQGFADLVLPLTFSYEVDLWGRIHRTIDLAREESQASAADLVNAQLSIQTDLAVDYFEVRAADAQRKLLEETIGDYREALRITTNRFQGGVVAESDVFQAQTQLQAAIVQAEDTAVRRAQYEHAIAVLIGQPPNSFSMPVSPLIAQPPSIPVGLPSELLERRPDIAAAERRTAEANERIGIARAAYFPALNLAASLGFESTTLAGFFNASNVVYALGPTLAYTFFDAGRRGYITAQANAGFDQASADYRQTALTAFQQVEDNLAALRILADEQAEQGKATAAAKGAQQIFNNRYVGGIDTYLQVVTAQQTALNNQRNDIDILRRRMDASVLLIKALGGGWDTTKLVQP